MSWKNIFPTQNRYFETENGILYKGHVLDILKTLPDDSIDIVVTSPPYWNLRSYTNAETVWGGDPNCEHEWDFTVENKNYIPSDKSNLSNGRGVGPKMKQFDTTVTQAFCVKCGAWLGQLGQEPDFFMYLEHLWRIFDEVKRILKPSGVLFVNLGDTYFSKSKGGGGQNSAKLAIKGQSNFQSFPIVKINMDYPEKSLCLIPERFAIGMIEHGWTLRDRIIWAKKIWVGASNNTLGTALPAPYTDRFVNTWEFVFMFTKSKRYNYDITKVLVPYKTPLNRWGGDYLNPNSISLRDVATGQNTYRKRSMRPDPEGARRPNVWLIYPSQMPFVHFAPFPTKLVSELIKPAITGQPLVIFDPFMGSGTTALVAEKMGQNWVGIEISDKYCDIVKERILPYASQLKLFKRGVMNHD